MDDNKRFFDGMQPCEFPEKLKKFLQEASIFYHVPYQYLVPNQQIMKEDEIHFFKVDHNWVLAFLDGICSVGRNASIDYAHDTRWITEQYQEALGRSADVRRRLLGREAADEEAGRIPFGTVTGFLLHSVVAEDFRGLEFQAYGDEEGKERLKALRIEKLGPRMLVGLFGGTLRRLEISQPPEGLHYGGEKGSLPLRDECEGRILDVEKLAEKVKEMQRTERVTAAEIAVEMVQKVQSATFVICEETDDEDLSDSRRNIDSGKRRS